MRRGLAVLVGILFAVCCVVAAVVGGLAYFFYVPTAEAQPVVLIESPRYGEQIAVGERVAIRAIARDGAKVTLVELWLDGQLLEARRSPLPGGITPFPLLTDWEPLSPGTHTLTARAFNAQGAQGQASVNVEAIEPTDRDGDAVPDEGDLCADEPGWEASRGCPDRDGDGIPDAEDACPDEAGLPEAEGCPLPGDEDLDGDGVPNGADACPDEPGSFVTEGCPDADGDGVADAEDACPDEAGLPEHDGCTVEGDLDGDGIPDEEDECPEEWGLPEHAGCPDIDGDGIRDQDDTCPDVPGVPDLDGCPFVDVGPGGGGGADEDMPEGDGDDVPDADMVDSDGDGVPDDEDECPEDPGEPPSGCPPPDGGVEEEDGGITELLDIGPFLRSVYRVEDVTYVEVQVYEFEVLDDYDSIYCYLSLGGEPEEQYGPFAPAGERYWNVPEDLGSFRVVVPVDGPLDVYVECEALVTWRSPGPGPGDGTGYFIPLGSYSASHDPRDWDGHEIEAESSGGENQFRALYRICAGSCEGAAFAPPILTHLGLAGSEVYVHWTWDGDRAAIDGFNVYMDDNHVGCISPHFDSAPFSRPPCGRSSQFEVTAFEGPFDCRRPLRESPRSNSEVRTEPPCPRTVQVTFSGLHTYQLGYYNGPIMGQFFANEGEGIVFDASSGGGRGLRLEPHSAYDIRADIWDWISEHRARCGIGGSCPYGTSGPNSVAVELGPDDDLTFGGTITDGDGRTLFDGEHTVSGRDITPGPVTIRGWKMDLIVLIDVTIDPGASGRPDLVISDVTQDEASGQLLIAVFNGAARLESRDIAVRLERIADGEIVGSHSWEDVTLAPGEVRVLHDPALVVEPRDLRVIIDPDNDIDEVEEGNNTYETPLVLRVEFLELDVMRRCLESRIVDLVSEFVFRAYVSHRAPGHGEDRFGGLARFPESGYFYYGSGHPDNSRTLGGELYTLEFEMPRDGSLYIGLTGEEVDPRGVDAIPSSPDRMGYVRVLYEPDSLLAEEPEPSYVFEGRTYPHLPGLVYSEGEQSCDDPNCDLGCWFWVVWRITRVH
jgi:hypothetical protein